MTNKELAEKLNASRSKEETLSILKKSGLNLSEEQMKQISGGGDIYIQPGELDNVDDPINYLINKITNS